MKKLKIYLDTSVYNFVIAEDSPDEREVTIKLMEEIKEGKYEVYISEVVTLEINRAPKEIALKLRDIIKEIDPVKLEIGAEVQELANRYIAEGIIPEKYEDDALHIATAVINNIDVIISWNFKHIVKLKTKRETSGVNMLMGYKPIDIYSPREVAESD